MTSVFADTSFFLGFLNPGDELHQRAVECSKVLEAPLICTTSVLLETANGLSASRHRARFGLLLRSLRENATVEVIESDPDYFSRGCELYLARLDKDWSLTDCISFLVMKDRGLTDALTADHHFEQAGFRALLLG